MQLKVNGTIYLFIFYIWNSSNQTLGCVGHVTSFLVYFKSFNVYGNPSANGRVLTNKCKCKMYDMLLKQNPERGGRIFL